MTNPVERFEAMLAAGNDSALLRFSLGNAYLANDPEKACEHLTQAVTLDPQYSAAWKLLGKARTANGDDEGAIAAYTQGIEVAEQRGDIQAAKEMRVFLTRLNRPA